MVGPVLVIRIGPGLEAMAGPGLVVRTGLGLNGELDSLSCTHMIF